MSAIETSAATLGLRVPGDVSCASLNGATLGAGFGSTFSAQVAAATNQNVAVPGMTATGKALAIITGAADANPIAVQATICGVDQVNVVYSGAAAGGVVAERVLVFVISLA
jgi:hypothetical protein